MAPESKKRIAIIGAGGHAKVVADIIERGGNFELSCMVDGDQALHGTCVYGYSVPGDESVLSDLPNPPSMTIVAIGSNPVRARLAAWARSMGLKLATAIHPSAVLSRGATVGDGTVIMAGAVVNADTRIGENVIINTRASVDHDCVIGDCVHIAPGAILCGTVRVGDGSFIAAGATVIPNITIGDNVIVGAGAVVIRDVPDNTTVVGNPARPIPHR